MGITVMKSQIGQIQSIAPAEPANLVTRVGKDRKQNTVDEKISRGI